MSKGDRIRPRLIEIAGEAFASCLLARAGYDVLVQYGPNQPGYDLQANKGSRSLRISVKGSQDGSWGLTQSHMKDGDYAAAAEAWRRKHGDDIVFILVQFKGVPLTGAPRAYVARAREIADFLKRARDGHGETILHEDHTYTRGKAKPGSIDRIPASWTFSVERIDTV